MCTSVNTTNWPKTPIWNIIYKLCIKNFIYITKIKICLFILVKTRTYKNCMGRRKKMTNILALSIARVLVNHPGLVYVHVYVCVFVFYCANQNLFTTQTNACTQQWCIAKYSSKLISIIFTSLARCLLLNDFPFLLLL